MRGPLHFPGIWLLPEPLPETTSHPFNHPGTVSHALDQMETKLFAAKEREREREGGKGREEGGEEGREGEREREREKERENVDLRINHHWLLL